MSQRCRLVVDLFAIASIRSEKGYAALCDMTDLYQQDTEVAFRLGLELEKWQCAAERSRQIDRPAEMEIHIQLLQEAT